MQMNIEVMECLMRNVIRYSLVLKKSPMDYEARANLCWIASWALNGFLENGTGRTPICHAIEHEVSGYYDIPHSFGMAVIVPKWLRHIICNETIDAICRFGSEVFGLDISVDSNGALAKQNMKTSIKLSKSVRGVIKNVFGEILREELHWKYLRQKSIRRRRKKKLLL